MLKKKLQNNSWAKFGYGMACGTSNSRTSPENIQVYFKSTMKIKFHKKITLYYNLTIL